MMKLIFTVLALTAASVSASYPHNAYIPVTISGQFFPCRGAMIDCMWIVTAASCFDDRAPLLPLEVYLGSTETKKYPRKSRALEVILHENYNKTTLENDIAVIKLRRGIIPDNYINIIELPSLNRENNLFISRSVIVSRYSEEVTNSYTVLSNAACSAELNVQLPDSKLCIKSRDACVLNFDRGGSIFLNGKNKMIGIMSRSPDGVCRYNRASVNTRVSSYLQWIKDKTGISYKDNKRQDAGNCSAPPEKVEEIEK